MALGCIQAMKCNANTCPVGITTHNPQLVAGLVAGHKNRRVANFHHGVINGICEIMGAMAIRDPDHLFPWHIMRRTGSNEFKHYGEIYEFLQPQTLLQEPYPESFRQAMQASAADTFAYAGVQP